MSKHKRQYFEDRGPWPCFLCGTMLADKYRRDIFEGWTWFTGYGAETVHFCPACCKDRADEIAAIRKRLDVRPSNYPLERASPHPTLGETPMMAAPLAKPSRR